MKSPTVDEMRDMFRAHTEAALKVIVEIMTTGTGAKGESVRLAAAKEILNRGWGRPPSYKDVEKDAPKEDPWRSLDGKTYAQVYAEKAAEVAAEAAAKAAKQAAASEPGASAQSAAPAPASQVRHPDPTGYIAKRALFSAPKSAATTPAPSR